MITFKQYYKQQQLIEENRRTFLKTLLGPLAAAAVTNPVKIANTIAKQAGLPWIKVTLESDFVMYDYKTVDPQAIAKIIATKGNYTPGVSKDGGVTIDYNDSSMDMMEVYVKPGTPIYKQMQARIAGDDQPEAGDAFEFDKQVFDTISDPDGSGASWLEQQLENDMDDSFMKYEKQPDDWKEEIATVDGFEPDHYEAAAQRDAADRVKQFLDQAGEIGTEVPDHMRDIVARGYMKSHVMANGGGAEEISTDTLANLQDLYPDERIDTPDEMDMDRWLDGTADNPMDTMGHYDREDYDRDMDQVAGELEYKDQDDDTQGRDDSEMTTVTVPGYDSSADNWAEAGFNFLMGASQTMQQVPVKHVMNVPGFYDAIKKGQEMNGDSEYTDIDEPLTIAHDGSDTIEIIGGFAQLAAADDEKMALNRIRMVHVDDLKAKPESTSKYLDNENI